MGVRCLLGKTVCGSAENSMSSSYNFGRDRSLDEFLMTFFYGFSKSFHSLILCSLAVTIFKYLP